MLVYTHHAEAILREVFRDDNKMDRLGILEPSGEDAGGME